MDQSEGGLGGVTNDRLATSEARLIEQAIRHGWPLNDRIKKLVVNRLAGIVDSSKSERSVIAASKGLIAVGKLNASIDRPQADTTVNVGVQVNQSLTKEQLANLSTDEIRSYIAIKRKLNGPGIDGPGNGTGEPLSV